MKTVLITGASSGVGLQLAKDYLAAGCSVIACGRSFDKLTEHLGPQHECLSFCIFDMTDKTSLKRALSRHHDLDVVILNAGTCEYIDNAKEFDGDLFARVIQTNVIGTGHCLSACLPNIVIGGQLVVVSSSVTLLPLTRAEAYGASKAALDYLSRTLMIDLASSEIDVSIVSPGFVKTPLTDKNNFSMPGIISVEKASKIIIKGIEKRKQEIRFPLQFFIVMKMLSILPSRLWQWLAVKMSKEAQTL